MMSGGRTRTSSTASSRMTWIRRASASSLAISRACSEGSTSASATTLPLDLRDGLLRDDDHVSVRQHRAFGDEGREVVSLPQLRQSLDRRHGEAGPDVLDEDEGRVLLVPQPVQLLEGDEADSLVERAGRVVAGIRPRRAERLHVEVADPPLPAPRLGRVDERPPDALPVLRRPHAQDVELGRRGRVLLERDEAEIRLRDERRQAGRILDVLPGGLLDAEPIRRSRSTASAMRDRSAGSEISTICVTGAQ